MLVYTSRSGIGPLPSRVHRLCNLDDETEHATYPRFLIRKPHAATLLDLVQQLDMVLRAEGRAAHSHLVEDGAYGPEVGLQGGRGLA